MDNRIIMEILSTSMDSVDFNLEALRVFLSVVEHQSFREAGRALGMPKSTVSKKVAELEGQLGAPLLQRTTRTMALTPVGTVMHQRGTLVLSQLAETSREIRESEREPSGPLRITAPPTFAEVFLVEAFVEFAQRYPKVRLSIDLSDHMVDIVADGIDIALRAGPLADSSLKARLLGLGRSVTVASPGFLKKHGLPTSIRELTALPCIALTSGRTPNQWPFRVGRKVSQLAINPVVSVNSMRLMAALAEGGVGVARVPEGLVGESLKRRRLISLLPDAQPPPMPMHAVFTPAAQMSSRVRAFLEVLVSHLSELAPEKMSAATRRRLR